MNDRESIIRYLKNESSPQERELLETWLQENESNRTLFEQVKNTWDISGVLAQDIRIDKSTAWQSIQQKITLEQEKGELPKHKKRTYLTWPVGIAASVAIAVLTICIYLFGTGAEQNDMVTTSTTDEQQVVVLSDCTRVILNKNSCLVYPKTFDAERREIRLTGEAFFEVTKNAEKPFIIENKNFYVTVLGTSFNVSAYEKDTNATVTVVTGTVALEAKEGKALILVKDETGLLNTLSKHLVKQPTADLNFLSWKTKTLEFKDASFQDVCDQLRDYFDIRLEVKNKEILKCTFTGYFEDPSLEQIISILEKTLNLNIQVNNKEVIITGKGC